LHIRKKNQIATPLLCASVYGINPSGLAMTGGNVIARERSDRGNLRFKKEPDSEAESGLRGKK
jgi:hypothetical protein